MKKSYLTIISIILCVGYGILSWDLITYSEAPDPETSLGALACKVINVKEGHVPDEEYDMCCIDYNEAIYAATKDWEANLKRIAAQERPASEMVEDAYESLRTYNCWLEYICGAVQYSGHAPIESTLNTGLTEEQIGRVPGCQAPEDLRMESNYNELAQSMSDIPILGVVGAEVADGVADTFGDFYTENKINFFPRCMTDELYNNEFADLTQTQLNYNACKKVMELYFGCPEGIDKVFCTDFSNAFVTLEDELKRAQAGQKAAALESKLGTIVTKMSGMEEHVNYMQDFLDRLESRFKCYISECD